MAAEPPSATKASDEERPTDRVDAPASAAGPLAARPGGDGIVAARVSAKAAATVALLLAAWLLATWLAGADHVEPVESATVDGGTVARVLAALLWALLAMSVVIGLVGARRRSSLVGDHHRASVLRRWAGPPAGAGSSVGRRWSSSSSSWSSRRWFPMTCVGTGAAFVLATYHGLLGPGAITWGDWRYFVNAGAVRAYFPVPSIWSFADLGNVNILGASLAPVESAMGLLARAGVPYAVLERVCFYFPAVVLSFTGPLLLARRLKAGWPTSVAAGAFYVTNPYALILISGGQLTVGVGYALFPWVALSAMGLWARRTVRSGILLGAVVALQGWYDLRTAGLSLAVMLIVAVVLAATNHKERVRHWPWPAIVTAGLLFGLLQGMWVVPAVFAVGTQVPAGYTTASALSSLSLLSLTDGLTLFHPFWPTMQFIALHSVPALWMAAPLVVAIALWRDPADRRILIGAVIYLVFAALVSGANEPFGPVNTWLFTHVPGMDLFRDPSPYLGPIALGLVVVAAAASGVGGTSTLQGVPVDTSAATGPIDVAGGPVRRRSTTSGIGAVRPLLAGVVAALVVVAAWPALTGSLRHNLQPVPVPNSYRQVDQAILQSPPGTVLWVPATSRFALQSPEHPSLSAITLESTAGIGFPPISQPLAWLGQPDTVRTLVDRYHIAAVVVRGGAAPYLGQSLAPAPTRSVALATFTSVSGSKPVRFPGLTLFTIGTATSYPTTVYQSPSPGSSGTATGMVGVPKPPLQELAVTGFQPGMPGWSAVGDGNNYLDQTLAQAGISATVRGSGDRRWLHLTVRYGAAVISQTLGRCPTSGLQELRIRYRTTGNASLNALVFSAAQQPPIGNVGLPDSEGRWTTTSVQFAVDPSLQLASAGRALTGCEFVLSAQPAVAGGLSAADVSALSLVAAPKAPGSRSVVSADPLAQWGGAAPPNVTVMSRTGDSLTVAIRPAPHSQLLVFWQRFSPQWEASPAPGRVEHHVKANGWANGYVVPPSASTVHIRIAYHPQQLSVDGALVVLAGICIAVLAAFTALGALLLRRAGRRSPGS